MNWRLGKSSQKQSSLRSMGFCKLQPPHRSFGARPQTTSQATRSFTKFINPQFRTPSFQVGRPDRHPPGSSLRVAIRAVCASGFALSRFPLRGVESEDGNRGRESLGDTLRTGGSLVVGALTSSPECLCRPSSVSPATTQSVEPPSRATGCLSGNRFVEPLGPSSQ